MEGDIGKGEIWCFGLFMGKDFSVQMVSWSWTKKLLKIKKKKSCSQEGSSSESNGSTYAPLHSQCLAWFPRERKTAMNVCLRSKAEGDIFSIKKEKAKQKHLWKKKNILRIIIEMTLLLRVITVIPIMKKCFVTDRVESFHSAVHCA